MSPKILGIVHQAGQILSENLPATNFTFPVCSCQIVSFFIRLWRFRQSSCCSLDHIIYKLSSFSIDSVRLMCLVHAAHVPGCTSTIAVILLHYDGLLVNPLDSKHFNVGDYVLFLSPSLSIPPLILGIYYSWENCSLNFITNEAIEGVCLGVSVG